MYTDSTPPFQGVNHIRCTFVASPVRHSRFNKYARVHTTETPAARTHGLIPAGMSTFPDYLKRVNHLSIDIILEYEFLAVMPRELDLDVATDWLGRCVLNLASFLMDEHRLKTLDIYFHSDDEEFDFEQAEDCLYPLRRLKNVPSVQIDGTVDDETIAEIESDIQESTPVFNTIKMFRLLRDEARAYIELERDLWPAKNLYDNDLNISGPATLNRSTPLAQETHTSAMKRLVDTIEHKLSGGLRSRHLEDGVLSLLAELQGHVDHVSKTQFFRKLSKVVGATKSRARYTTVPHRAENPRAPRASPEL